MHGEVREPLLHLLRDLRIANTRFAEVRLSRAIPASAVIKAREARIAAQQRRGRRAQERSRAPAMPSSRQTPPLVSSLGELPAHAFPATNRRHAPGSSVWPHRASAAPRAAPRCSTDTRPSRLKRLPPNAQREPRARVTAQAQLTTGTRIRISGGFVRAQARIGSGLCQIQCVCAWPADGVLARACRTEIAAKSSERVTSENFETVRQVIRNAARRRGVLSCALFSMLQGKFAQKTRG